MRNTLVLTLFALLLAAPALAGGNDCVLGHTGANDSAYNDGTFTAAVLVDPSDCTNCPVGVDIDEIHFVYTAEVECDRDVTIRLRSALTPGVNCAVEPGKIECEATKSIKFMPGTHEYAIKLGCLCADSDFLYYLEVEFGPGDCNGAGDGLTATNLDSGCGSYLDGNPSGPSTWNIHADATCCNKPVGNVDESFGGVKSRFED